MKSSSVGLFVLSALLFLGREICASGGIKTNSSGFRHDAWHTEDGLPQDSVESVLQTHDGKLWVGTLDGLVTFDGVRFSEVAFAGIDDRRARSVLALAEDADGAVWIGTNGAGLVRWKDGKTRVFRKEDGLASDVVRVLAADPVRGVWAAVWGGLVRVDEAGVRSMSTGTLLESITPSALLVEPSGVVLVGTAEGLFELRGDTAFWHAEFFRSHVNSVTRSPEGNLFVGFDEGLQVATPSGVHTYGLSDGLPSKIVRFAVVGREGDTWVGTDQGIALRDVGQPGFVTVDVGIETETIRRIFEDREGSVWIATAAAGLHRMCRTFVRTVGREEGLSADVAQCVLAGRGGGVWVGTTCGGLDRILDDRVEVIGLGQPNLCVWSLLESRDGTIWAGTWDQGIVRRFPDGRLDQIRKSKEGMPSDVVLCFAEGPDGAIWIGTYDGGLARWDAGKVTTWSTASGLPSNEIHALLVEPSGAIWIGTYGGGLARLDGNRIRKWTTHDGLPSNNIRSLYRDGAGTLWIGTYGSGLVRFRGGEFFSFRKKDGHSPDVVSAILEDGAGSLWLSTNRGVTKIAKKDLEEYSAGRTPNFPMVSISVSDGMRSPECNGGGGPTGTITSDGHLWFPTLRGVVEIDPQRQRQKAPSPSVWIESILLDGDPLDVRWDVEVGAGQKRLEFGFSASSFRAPERVRFRYLLEGFDRKWLDGDAARVASYTNVPPGRYRFRVTAANADGVWSKRDASVKVRILPSFYERKSFWFLVSFLAAAALAWFVRLRFRILEARSAVLTERNRLAREIHDTLAQDFTGIKMQLRVAELRIGSETSPASPYIEKAASLAQRGLEDASRSVWALQRQAMAAEEFHASLAGLGRDFSGEGPATFQLQFSGDPRTLRGDAALGFLRVAQEAISNARRHGSASRIEVEVVFEPRRVRMIVRDDGSGFDTSGIRRRAGPGGVGISSMRDRARELGGTLSIRSAPGQGTEIEISLPARRTLE